jgi:hypothetical protein
MREGERECASVGKREREVSMKGGKAEKKWSKEELEEAIKNAIRVRAPDFKAKARYGLLSLTLNPCKLSTTIFLLLSFL